ncbi:MAG: cytochrome c oxidase accessory protein CcoG, partial [Alphaproteobacteria bacterium]
FLWIEIWPQEVYYLTGILILAAIGLFLVTSIAGRLWCGYACPQTVWTDLFMWVERVVEGDRNARIKLDAQPLTVGKAGKKLVKHASWLIIAALTGGAWIMYFVDAPTVVREIFAGEASTYTYFFIGLFTATTYLLAGWAREQVCTYMCPWPRFQASMYDEDTLVVTYQKWRGEPRGKLTKGDERTGRGDCVDCGQCVAVCPTGIDIRDGVQLECIGCGLCIDACNGVMEKVNLPLGLIGFDTQRRMEQRGKSEKLGYRIVRPRTILYALLLIGVAAIMLVSLATRGSQDISVLHDRAPLFVRLSDGSIRNGYTIKISNMDRQPRSYQLRIEALANANMQIVGEDVARKTEFVLTAPADQVATYRLYLTVSPGTLRGEQTEFSFVLTNTESKDRTVTRSQFRGPRP